ncbi:MAG: hypothetical protein DKINENOH_03037 [bacterium]|nr:hypothetical protein [bacterium]
MTYRHTQVGTVIIIAVLSAAIVTLFVLVMGAGPSWFSPLTVLAIMGVVLAMFSSLTVEVEKSTLTCWFGVGFVRKTILLSEVDQVRAVVNPWFVGWGIRWIPGSYWVWNVSGFRAVELVMQNGTRFRIGTDQPEALVQAITLAKQTGA